LKEDPTKAITLDFGIMSIGALKESVSVLKAVRPDPIVNVVLSKLREEINRRNTNAK
jgi:hypothetical protein